MKTKIEQVQIPRNSEWVSRYDERIYRKRKVKRSPVQTFLFWFTMVIMIALISSRLALLVV